MRASTTILPIFVFAFTACASAADAPPPTILLNEHFDDAELLKRGWYDGDKFRIALDPWAGRGCIEFEWLEHAEKVSISSGVRHAIEPTDEVWLRFYLKLGKGWGWSGRDYHPHLLHFLTTENSKWHG